MPASPPPTVSLTRWPWWRRWFGARSERAAARYLSRIGLKIIARNVADSLGEIDLIALDRATLEIVIVEVRSTASSDLHRPLDSVNFAKQRQLTDAACRYLQRKRLLGQMNVRFDVLAICWPTEAATPIIHHVPNAFAAVGRFQFWN